MATIRVDELDQRIADVLDKYRGMVRDGVEDEMEGAAVIAMRIVRDKSPTRTGKYKKGWKLYREKAKFKGQLQTLTVYNKTQYRLIHLLEFGHQTAKGTRTKAYPHVQPAEDAAEKALIVGVRRVIEEAGL